MKIVLASRNKKKIAELQAILSAFIADITVLSLDDVGYYDDIIEDGDTFEKNAFIKARAPKCQYPVIADDSGLIVPALDGAPGVYSARYAGEDADDAANNEKLLKELKHFPKSEWSASFVSFIACVFPDGREISAEGECKGMIIDEYRGNNGFGYDPLFYVPEMDKTFAEMTSEEKNSFSHRAVALQNFAKEFVKAINE